MDLPRFPRLSAVPNPIMGTGILIDAIRIALVAGDAISIILTIVLGVVAFLQYLLVKCS